MAKFRKKPVVIEAIQWEGDIESEEAISDFSGGLVIANDDPDPDHLTIPTLEGNMTASVGDWIIKGVNGEFYPCKPDIFEKTYELVD